MIFSRVQMSFFAQTATATRLEAAKFVPVAVTVTATETVTNCDTVPVAVAVGAAFKKAINCNKDKLSCSRQCCSCSNTVLEIKSLNLASKLAKKVFFCQKWQNNFFSS